jgi:hypothetical protein
MGTKRTTVSELRVAFNDFAAGEKATREREAFSRSIKRATGRPAAFNFKISKPTPPPPPDQP